MKIEVVWMDRIEQEWEVLPYKAIWATECYLQKNCIQFNGKKIQPKGLKSDTIERDVIIPFQGVRWIEVLE